MALTNVPNFSYLRLVSTDWKKASWGYVATDGVERREDGGLWRPRSEDFTFNAETSAAWIRVSATTALTLW